jgi:hypothetical protein
MASLLAYHVAGIYAGLRQSISTIEWLNYAIEQKSMQLFLFPSHPRFLWLHDDADFRAAVRHIGLRLSS